MQVRCPRCTEPWETDIFHEIARKTGTGFLPEYRRFKKFGCAAILNGLEGIRANKPTCEQTPEGLTIGALLDLCGDDSDAAACEIEDAEYMGVL